MKVEVRLMIECDQPDFMRFLRDSTLSDGRDVTTETWFLCVLALLCQSEFTDHSVRKIGK